ncbi:TPA: fimbrial protein [Yersinia enterocolitica]
MSIFNKAVLAATIFSTFAFTAQAADDASGNVTFTGSIIDSPCSIKPQSGDQTVDLGQISSAALTSKGTSTPRNFSIELEKCDIATMKNVAITFTGSTDNVDPALLGITGTAKGAGVVITDGSGATIKLGQASAPRALGVGTNTLQYSAYLQGNSATVGSVVPGEFTSVANFTLAYN